MANSLLQTDVFTTARAELDASAVGESFAAVTFTNGTDSVSEFQCEGYSSLHVMALAATEDVDVKVQVRNTSDDAWVDLANEVAVSTTAVDVYEGVIRAARMRIVQKDASTAGGSVNISLCLSK